MKSSCLRLLVLACAIGLGACRGRESAATGGILVISSGADAATLFPPLATSNSQSRAVSELIYDKLADVGPGLNTFGDAGFVPRLARHWEWSADSLTVAFHLDPKARWHDGVPVTARDVQYAFRVWSDSVVGAPQRAWLANVDSISAPDSLTARVHFRARSPEQFFSLVYVLVPLPSHRLASLADSTLRDAAEFRAPVGNGAFRFVSWTPRARIELTANADYYRGRPSLDGVVFSVAAQGATVAAKLFSGEADFMEQLAPPDFAQLAASPSAHAKPFASLDYAFLLFNQRDPAALGRPHPLFADRTLRRALTMAVDRSTLVRGVFDSLGYVAVGPFSRTQWTADTTVAVIPYDRAGAARLLDSLGWKAGSNGMRARAGRPLRFTILSPSSSRTRQAAAVILQEQLRQVGVDVRVEGVDFSTFSDKSDHGAFDAAMGGVRTTPSPRGIREYWSTSGPDRGQKNFARWSNAVFDAQVDSALTATSVDAIRAHLRAAYQAAIDDAPAIWLYEPRIFAGVHERLTTSHLRPDAWWAGIPEWRIDPDRRLPRDRRAAAP